MTQCHFAIQKLSLLTHHGKLWFRLMLQLDIKGYSCACVQGHCRAAASLWAHGQRDMAVAAYRRAVALEPTCQPALAGLEKLGAQ